jgi:hypothetical protein
MDSYRIYAIEYARRQANPADVFLRSQLQEPMLMNSYIWAVVEPHGTIVVDTGSTDETARARGQRELRVPRTGPRGAGTVQNSCL